jgi:uncharacterized protein YjbJ (UPF0337 family)
MGANEERIKGKAEEIKGHIKHGVGSAFGNEQMEAEGHAEETAARMRPRRQSASKAAAKN